MLNFYYRDFNYCFFFEDIGIIYYIDDIFIEFSERILLNVLKFLERYLDC